MSRHEGYVISQTAQISVVRNADTTARNSTLCVSRDEGYPTSRTDQTSVVRKSHATAREQQALREQGRRLLYFANRPDIRDTELPHHRTRTAGFGYAATKVTVLREQTKHQWCGTPTPRHDNSRLCVSRDESYPTSRN